MWGWLARLTRAYSGEGLFGLVANDADLVAVEVAKIGAVVIAMVLRA
jgi:hypothetical protein